jgi:FtsP/CotA-like multicopper oxidase with cupredoxin domain
MTKQRQRLTFGRRKFIQLGGAAAAVPALTAQTPVAPAGPPAPPAPPSVDRVIDPAAITAENWLEPWVWRPADWPDQSLDLNVVENQNPGPSPSPGNRYPTLFSFGGMSPAPTIRLRGDALLNVRVRNLLGMNHGVTPAGPAPDPFELPPALAKELGCQAAKQDGLPCSETPPPLATVADHQSDAYHIVNARVLNSYAITEGANGAHATRVTNLHTHGLHVEPLVNPNGTFGDNVFLRLLPHGDWEARRKDAAPNPPALGADERVGAASFQYQLGDVLRARSRQQGLPPQPQPPGTHWYHPHAHGATHDQVSSGMAGFLIIEGDVDEAINLALAGEAKPDPCEKTGPYDYRERLVLIQRVEVQSSDIEARPGPRGRGLRVPAPVAVNGARPPTVMCMRPGAVERWRVLNGSVDGRGFQRFMVLEGQFVQDDENGQLWRVIADPPAASASTTPASASASTTPASASTTPAGGSPPPPKRRLVAVSRQEIEDAKRHLYQLSWDGITLVTVEDGKARHTIKDLSLQNAGSSNPFTRKAGPGEHPWRAELRNFEDCFRDGQSIRNAFVRPNEVYMATANRADVFFKAPPGSAGKVYTLLAQEVQLHTDNYQQRLQQGIHRNQPRFNPAPIDVVAAYVHVRGTPVEGGDFDVMSLASRLPPVPPFLQPVGEDELRVTADEARRRKVADGSFRTRVIGYSGYGSADFPLLDAPPAFVKAHPELKNLVWANIDGGDVLLPPASRTMAINSRMDLALHPEPPIPRKFAHHDEEYVRTLVDTAEEWVLYNSSMMLWGHTDTQKHRQPGQFQAHYKSYVIPRSEGQARFARDSQFQITAKGADHPFHIHINPSWVMRIEIPDETGRLHNILDEPRWMDTIPIPRNGGRVVFRMRFADITGRWVHHCHILQHEDHGMMQTVECSDRVEGANYSPRTRVASHRASSEEVTAIYPRPSLEISYKQNLMFIDTDHATGLIWPGFEVTPPKLGD